MQPPSTVGLPIPNEQPQQWVMFQQQQPPPPMAIHQQQYMAQVEQAGVYQSNSQNPGEVRSLWVGDLQFWMDENYIYGCFYHTGEVSNVKIIRNKQTMVSEGYGFIEFNSHAAAERVLQTYNGAIMPQTEQTFRLNWAAFGMSDRRTDGVGQDHTIFVGDLAPDVSDYVLQETFRSHYSSVKGAKVVMDTITGRSKGYGFVRFGDESEKTRAMSEMNGVYCSSRPMRISVATPKKSMGVTQQYNTKDYGAASAQGFVTDNDPNNTTVFVGGLDPNVTDEDLRQVFAQFGELVSVKIPAGKGCGFVQFTQRACAEEAIQKLHGTVIGQQSVRLSWGRSPANKQRQSGVWGQAQSDPNQGNLNYYNYGQGYEGYGYAPPPQEGTVYAYPSYPGYGSYPQQTS